MQASQRAVAWLGAGQCLYWGVLYYGFAVLLAPLARDLSVPGNDVATAFSLGLLLAAVLAPRVGRWVDAGRARQLIAAGAALAATGLLVLAAAQGRAGLFAGWLLVGLAMALLLYETAFGVVIRAHRDPWQRMRALAVVTVFGGLASTVFLPLMAWLCGTLGWRQTLVAFAVVICLKAAWLDRQVLARLPAAPGEAQDEATSSVVAAGRAPWRLVLPFSVSSFSAAALVTLLVPMLVARGHAATLAAGVLGALGIMQLPGRLWLSRSRRRPGARFLVFVPLLLQATGLLMVLVPAGWPPAALGVALFGLGAGVHTLARPWLVQQMAGVDRAGRWNGQVSRWQGIARALGPASVAWASMRLGEGAIFALLAVALLAVLPMAASLARPPVLTLERTTH